MEKRELSCTVGENVNWYRHNGEQYVVLCLTLCNAMDYSTPDFPVLHYPPESMQTHVRWVDDAV